MLAVIGAPSSESFHMEPVFFKIEHSLAQGSTAAFFFLANRLFFFRLVEIRFVSVITEPVLVVHEIPSALCFPTYSLDHAVNPKET